MTQDFALGMFVGVVAALVVVLTLSAWNVHKDRFKVSATAYVWPLNVLMWVALVVHAVVAP